MARQGEGFNRDGLRDWDFGALPETVRTEAGVEAWPALVDQDSAVGLRLFETAGEALAEHREGVLGLLALRLADKLRWLVRHHGLPRNAQLAWVGRADPAPTVDELVSDLARHALYECAEPNLAGVREQQAFEALAQRVRAGLGPVFQRLIADLARVMESLPELERQLAALEDRTAGIVEDLGAWLVDLVYPGFLLELEPGRFRHYPRYLASAGQRLEAQARDPSRDTRLQEQLAPFQSRYDDWLTAGKPYVEELDGYRWLLAEYRVSLFAQRLGTVEKVSPKRLEKAWQAVLDAESEW
jgi:ATP-dependent helicase HrpA